MPDIDNLLLAVAVLWRGGALATLGVAGTALLAGWFATAVLGFGWREGLLLGSILSSTDSAAMFGVGLKGRLRPLLELESGGDGFLAVQHQERLPRTALVILIARGDDHVIPRGGTVIEAGGTLMVLADEEALNQVRTTVGASAGSGG